MSEPIKVDIATAAQFVMRVQADALLSIAVPLIEELSKRPQTQWGVIIEHLRARALNLNAAADKPVEPTQKRLSIAEQLEAEARVHPFPTVALLMRRAATELKESVKN